MMFQFVRVRRFFLVGLAVFIIAIPTFADTLRLKDGSIIKGRIVSFSGGKFTIIVGEGSRQRELTYYADEVESIQFEAPSNTSLAGTSQPVVARPAEPEFVETSSPPKTTPRVVITDSLGSAPQRQTSKVEEAVQKTASPSTSSSIKPIEVVVKVLADNTANGWTNSGWVVKKGQRIRISGSGTISLGRGRTTGPSGLFDVEDPDKLLKSVPTGALIAVIGDDNNQFIYVGSERTFVAERDGILFLGVNEGNLDDNSGAFDVRVEIDPA